MRRRVRVRGALVRCTLALLALLTFGCDPATPGLDAGTRPRDAGPDASLGRDGGGTDASASDAFVPDASSAADAGMLDEDGDGVDSTTEVACGTDPTDSASHPDPEVLLGAGTDADPYRLCFGRHLALFAALANASSSSARLGRDIDVTDIDVPALGPVGDPFVAVLDGAGHAISNLHVGATGAGRMGLIENLAEGGVVRDLTFTDAVAIEGPVVVGTSAGLLERVTVHATTVSSGSHIGILVGSNGGEVIECASHGSIEAGNHVGGLVGANSGTIRRSASTAAVRANNRVGGLVGSQFSLIEECWASGMVDGTGMDAGGLVGTAFSGSIVDSYALGDVTQSQVAGRAGGLVGGTSADVVIERVYARGRVTGGVSAGVVGDSLATSPPTACFFDASTGGSDALCTGLTPAQMTMASSFVGFDFVTPIWVLAPAMRSSPVLAWETARP
ncbi:MAG: GLUG motif-containing protein [Sandaracinaceae bacterium]